MKKLVVGMLVCGIAFGLSGCGSNEDKTTKASSSIEQSTEDSSAKEAEKMKKIEEKLNDNGVETQDLDEYINLVREKGIDYYYFKMTFTIDTSNGDILDIMLTLKGNIDGKEQDVLIYKVSSGRIVESSGDNTDITKMSEVLKSLDLSDQELVEFVQWYYQENNK